MNVLSLFDGMSCGQLALKKAGIKVDNYYSSEIDKYAIQVTQKNFPKTIQLGDIKDWNNWELPKIDLLIGGSPCQNLSFAGKGGGLEGERSGLFYVYNDIKNHYEPDFFLLENVKMKKKWESIITGKLGVEPIEINSSLVSAQNRKRLYWTNIPNIKQPLDEKITWGDVREYGENEKSFFYTPKAMQWLARHSRKKGKLLKVHAKDEKMQMLEASHHKKYSSQRFFGIVDLPSDKQCIAAMRGRYLINGKRQDGKQKTKGLTQQYIEFRYDEKSNALTTVSKDNIIVPFTLPNRVPKDEFFFRYITPRECERLQNVPDDFTDCVSKTQRYKMLGNGWTVDVIAHILKNMKNLILR